MLLVLLKTGLFPDITPTFHLRFRSSIIVYSAITCRTLIFLRQSIAIFLYTN